ncbi:MAG: Ig-like domain-containing protein, partial [Methanocellales archaeon]|nr:Ig-like domain-containing protein [Methanocellales archaeon]
TYSATVPLIEGSNTITATATDLAGNKGIAETTIFRDMVAPTISDLTPADGAYVATATPTISATISDAAPSSGIDAGSIVMTVDGLTVTHAYNSSTGVVSYTPSELTPLADGSHVVTVDVSDLAGNAAETASWSFTVDITPPVVTIGPVTTPTNVATQTIAGAYTEVNLAGIDVNGVEAIVTPGVTPGTGTYSATVPLIEGSNTITAT